MIDCSTNHQLKISPNTARKAGYGKSAEHFFCCKFVKLLQKKDLWSVLEFQWRHFLVGKAQWIAQMFKKYLPRNYSISFIFLWVSTNKADFALYGRVSSLSRILHTVCIHLARELVSCSGEGGLFVCVHHCLYVYMLVCVHQRGRCEVSKGNCSHDAALP